VRSTTTREPEWTDQDLAEYEAWAEYEASLCPCGCGFLKAETTSSHDTGPEFDVSTTTCRARASLLEAKRAVADGKGANPDEPARLYTIRKIGGR
jgi:hypothetical protein